MAEPLARVTAALADRYKFERRLGEGGMATVYLAEDVKHKRKVAIKVLKPDPEYEWMREEAQQALEMLARGR